MGQPVPMRGACGRAGRRGSERGALAFDANVTRGTGLPDGVVAVIADDDQIARRQRIEIYPGEDERDTPAPTGYGPLGRSHRLAARQHRGDCYGETAARGGREPSADTDCAAHREPEMPECCVRGPRSRFALLCAGLGREPGETGVARIREIATAPALRGGPVPMTTDGGVVSGASLSDPPSGTSDEPPPPPPTSPPDTASPPITPAPPPPP